MVLSKNENPIAQVMSKPQQISIVQTQRMSQTQAEMLIRVQMAHLVRRSWAEVQGAILNECENPEFAHKSIYTLGGTEPVQDLSIRFAERVMQLMGSVSYDMSPEGSDERFSYFRCTVVDMENNAPSSKTFQVSKVTNKREVTEEEFVVEERKDTRGPLYVVEVSDQEMAARVGAVESRTKRGLILSLLPADVRAAALEKCLEVIASDTAKDPQAATKEILKSYLALGIEPSELKAYLGKSVQSATESDLLELRGLLTTMREGHSTWQQLLERKTGAKKTGVKEAFVDQRAKEKAKQQSATGRIGATATTPAAGAAASARRGRRTNAQIAADNAAAEAAKSGQAAAGTGAATTAPQPPAPPAPRASRRDEEDDEEEDTDDEAPDSAPASASSTDSSTAASSK